MGATLIIGLVYGSIYALLALGIVLVYKGSRVINFAQGEMGGLALYIAWWLTERHGQPWIVGAVAAVTGVGLLGFLFERLVVRRMQEASRLAVTVATIGLLLLLFGAELKRWGINPSSLRAPVEGKGWNVLGWVLTPTQLISFGVVLAITLGLAAFFRKTDFGLGVLAAAQDPNATRLMGVPVTRVSSFTWTSAGVIAAIAALLIEPTVTVFTPGSMNLFFINALAAALVGGLTSMSGALVGGFAVGMIEAFVGRAFVTSTVTGIQTVSIMVVILGVLIVRPQGILGKARA